MIKIRQRHAHDCGVACTAMLLGVTYEAAETAFRETGLHLPRGRRMPYSSNFKNLMAVAHHLGRTLVMRRFSAWNAIADAAIVKVHRQTSGNWHWVVAVRREHGIEILDPATDLPSFEVEPMNCEGIDFTWYTPSGNVLLISPEHGPAH